MTTGHISLDRTQLRRGVPDKNQMGGAQNMACEISLCYSKGIFSGVFQRGHPLFDNSHGKQGSGATWWLY